MNAATPWLRLLTLTALLVLGACGGGVGGSGSGTTAEGGTGGSGSGDQQYAEGGMGGSGSGTSSGYGSIIVNETRHFPIDPFADITVDGERVAADAINDVDKGVPLGMTLEYVLADDANDAVTEGTAIRIRANHRAIGPVTGTDPLEVLGQTVQVTTETRGLSEQQSKELTAGDVVKVDGHVDGDGVIRATRLVERTLNRWQLVGRITAVTDGGFAVGAQQVELNGAPIRECGTALETGERVVVRASKPETYTPGDALKTVLEVRCLSEGLSLFGIPDEDGPDVPPELAASYEGIVTEIVSDLSAGLSTSLRDLRDGGEPLVLSLNGQKVAIPLDHLPQLLSGTLNDLVENLGVGVRIEVQGTLDTDTGVIMADKIRFRDPLINIEGPLEDGVDGAVQALGRTLRASPGAVGDTGLLNGPVGDTQAAVQGFIADDGTVYATEVADLGSAAPEQVYLRAPLRQQDDTVMIGRNPYALDSAGEIILLEGYELLGTLVETLLTTTCDLLPLLCPESVDQTLPSDLTDSVGTVSDAHWTGSALEQGTLKVRTPEQ